MKHDLKSIAQEFESAGRWVNHYHYRYGQHHLGRISHPTQEFADAYRKEYFDYCRHYLEKTGHTVFFNIETRVIGAELNPVPQSRRLPFRAYFDDCILHYALPEGP